MKFRLACLLSLLCLFCLLGLIFLQIGFSRKPLIKNRIYSEKKANKGLTEKQGLEKVEVKKVQETKEQKLSRLEIIRFYRKTAQEIELVLEIEKVALEIQKIGRKEIYRVAESQELLTEKELKTFSLQIEEIEKDLQLQINQLSPSFMSVSQKIYNQAKSHIEKIFMHYGFSEKEASQIAARHYLISYMREIRKLQAKATGRWVDAFFEESFPRFKLILPEVKRIKRELEELIKRGPFEKSEELITWAGLLSKTKIALFRPDISVRLFDSSSSSNLL